MDIMKIRPEKTIYAGIVILFVFFGGLGTWSYFFPMTGAVIAPGTVKITREKKTVQHLEGGIIDKIFIKEGDIIEKNDLLIRLKGSRVDASISLLQGHIWFKMAEEARLISENLFNDSISWPGPILDNRNVQEVSDAMRLETDIFQSKKTNLYVKKERYRSQIKQLEKRIAGAGENLKAQVEIISLLQYEIKAKEKLFKKGYMDEVQILERKRKLLERKGLSAEIEQEIAETYQKIEEIWMKISELKHEYQEEAITELGEISDTIFELQERIIPLKDQKRRLDIVSPIGGEIINLQFHSESSGVIKPGESILEIVPRNAEMLIEALINKQDIAKISKGQEAKVQLTAFNRRKVPPVPGNVIYISGDQISKETPMGTQRFYIAHVLVDKTFLEKHDAYLFPGMPTVCFISTKTRTVMDYLLEPIIDVLDYALKET